ncbi:hypothetical protein M070_3290 [Bacteroides fragilis str. A7 (UDC12-2)]|uniref:Uncharacterized protein n=2 Tax=Bacteroides fragilis TaxID=817 RepID=A0A015X6S7_BACFG|nr:hypothetical protein M121_3071 [Bacteroides fragilis str. 3783N2-1]EXY54927.1 hypothetical protein M122_3046 [Bacteroides fragilis str. 3976T7]EXY99356.1 hypothetical protein M074_3422 [Bacteroides fragilis str. DS-166]EXZ27398.1 hypothetical protein M136_3432 [Bacteroides fragilis str. S36L11]EXZ47825.1 hypothetical protein M109_3316 [Bacteroides fragilis str. 3397 N2]EXZ52341.1 hypothetical protein M108_3399 [Bacteroides fragilis str. 3397 T14]EYA42516.1 hypothetical protein M110_3441 [B
MKDHLYWKIVSNCMHEPSKAGKIVSKENTVVTSMFDKCISC